jgi:hypothetical protein
MTTPQPGRACPVDLHYPEPRPPDLDVAAIIGHGRRIRRRRRLTQAGAALAACVAVGSVIAGVRGHTISMFPSPSGPPATPSAAPIDAQVAEDPPANGELTLISSLPKHWTTVAWATKRGEVCVATFRTPMQAGTEEFDCPGWSRSEVPGSGGGNLSRWLPDLGLVWATKNGEWPMLGLTSPRAVRVMVTVDGRDFSASVVPVPISAGKTVGVFLAWIKTPSGDITDTDVISEAAYDQEGHVFARVSIQ